jgi:glycosyltransferase involved in cell wall biosynthesis
LVPTARLTVVGRSPSAGTRAIAARNLAIEVTGSVPDVRPYLERAAVSIVPLRIGGGTRLKIYEAMAMGAPIVSTTIGAEGLPLREGEHLLIADTPEAQALAIASLLREPHRASAIALSAQQYVRAHCGWDAVAKQFLAQCVVACKVQSFTN